MNGQIIKFELKKVFTSPIVWVLMVVFVLFNGIIIFSNAHFRPDMFVLTSMVQRYGHEINEETLINWEQEHGRLLAKANEGIEEDFESAMDFFDDSETWMLGEEIRNQFAEMMIMEHYLVTAWEADDIYSEIDMVKKGEEEIVRYGLSGRAAETIRDNYQVAQERIEELVASGDHRHFFFDGYTFEMHSFLFNGVLKIVTFEIAILVVLLTAFLLSYEFDNQTYLVTYATKCGRRLQLEKLKSALIVSSLLTLGLIGVTLTLFFSVYHYSELWNVPISSIFMSEFNQFLASAFPMTFLQYLFAVIGVIFGIQLLFVLLAFVIGTVFKNSYLVIVIFAVLFGGSLLLPEMFSRGGLLFIYSAFTPFYLGYNLGVSFMMTGLANSFQFYEVVTLVVWGAGLLALVLICYRNFNIRDL